MILTQIRCETGCKLTEETDETKQKKDIGGLFIPAGLFLGMGIGFISATLSVTLMILPTIVRTSEEALKSVPMSFREGSLALGATKLQTVIKVVIPAASPGILTGVILGVGRVIGETAVLLYTLGSSYDLVRSLTSSARVLSLHLYLLFSIRNEKTPVIYELPRKLLIPGIVNFS